MRKYFFFCFFSGLLVACQSSPVNLATPVTSSTATYHLASNTPEIILTTPQITATPLFLPLNGTDNDLLEEWIAIEYYDFCIGKNEAKSSTGWDASSLNYIETNLAFETNKIVISEVADNLDNNLRAFVTYDTDLQNNNIYIKNIKTEKVYEIDWKIKSLSNVIENITWINYDTFMFFQSIDSTSGQIIVINFDKKEYLYSAIAYPKSNCPIATPTLTPLPSYPLKEVLVNYTVQGFHTPYDLFYVDYDNSGSFFVIYTDGQVIFPGNPSQEKILSADELNQFLKNLESLGFYNLNNEHLYDFGGQEPPKVFDGTSYCISVTGDKEQNLCAYEPYEDYLLPEMKNILVFLNNYQPSKMSPYYSDRILIWVQAGRIPYATNLPKDSILWTEQSVSLETDTEKIIYIDGKIAQELNRLYGNKNYVFVQNGKEYTVSIQEVLPHRELTNNNYQ